MDKDSVIVVYIPDKGEFLKQFYGLYYSVAHKTDLHNRFDFLVAGPKSIRNRIPHEHCKFIEINEISLREEFRYAYSNNPYGYVDSFAPFVDEEGIDILLNYKYCIRLDVDTFLCKGINSIEIENDQIYTGNAAYSSEYARSKLPAIMSNLGLADQDIHNLGSTWFARTEDMIRQGARTVDFVSYFLKNEFTEGEGKWPRWYAGVILLYAGHVALNSSGLNIQKTHQFDYHSTSGEEAEQYYSIHCWHTEDFFSKFAYTRGDYANRLAKPDSPRCDEYSFHCITEGAKLLSQITQNA
jgi:hypothetical protein